jgi:hypothetical protein
MNEIHSSLDMVKGITYNSAFFCDCVVSDLVENFCADRHKNTLKGIVVHLDNAHPHNSKQSCQSLEGFHAHRIPDLAYSQALPT